MGKESKNSVSKSLKPGSASGRKMSCDTVFFLQTGHLHPMRSGDLRKGSRRTEKQFLDNHRFLELDYFSLFWIFVFGCMVGLAIETLFRAIQIGSYESRAGLVWGPFSPIYGVGAVALTLLLNRLYHMHSIVVFLISMVVGSLVEFMASWGMEYFWGAIAWDYSGSLGSIQGRTNLAFGLMWGFLGLLWVRVVMPLMKRVLSAINTKNLIVRVATITMSVFMAINISITVLALDRESQRASDVSATTWEQEFFDDYFPDSFMQARFENMSVHGRS